MTLKIKWGIPKKLKEYQVIADKFKNKIYEYSQGNLEIESVIFDQDDLEDPIKDVMSGNLDIYQVPSVQFRNLTNIEWLKCWEVPFLFQDKNHVEKYIKSDRAKKTLKTLETESILPLTYSYAGGFMSVVKRKDGEIDNLADPKLVIHNFKTEEIDEINMSYLYANLPCSILMYELHRVSQLKEFKHTLEVELTNHMVQSRITIISKNTLASIPQEYQQYFLTTLEELLDEERNTIYGRAEKNTAIALEDQNLKVKVWNNQEKEDYFKKSLIKGSDTLNNEIDYIISLRSTL